MSRSFAVFLPERPEVRLLLEGLGWRQSPEDPSDPDGLEQFVLEGRNWQATLWGPSPMSWEDAPPEANALQAGIAWHVSASVEGSSFERGVGKVMKALRSIAKAGHGVLGDEDHVWKPGSSRWTRWSVPVPALASEKEAVKMIWWAIGPALFSYEGAT